MGLFGTKRVCFKSMLSMTRKSEGTAILTWWPLDRCSCFGEGSGNGDRKSEGSSSLHKDGFHSWPFLGRDMRVFSPSAVHKAGSQPLSLQHIGISRFKTTRLGFFG